MKFHTRTSFLTLTALGVALPLCAVRSDAKTKATPTPSPTPSASPMPSAGIVVTQAVPVKMPTSFNQGILFPYSYLDAAIGDKINDKGGVDYAVLRGDANLTIFMQAISSADLKAFPAFPVKDSKTGETRQTRNAELVFWINAYNAHVLKAVSEAYPVGKISDIKDFDAAKTRLVAGENYSFQELRRKIFGFDPRALFALADGSRGGPLILPRSYRFRTINGDLNDAVSRFVSDPRNVEISRLQSKITISDYFKIFNDLVGVKNQDTRKMTRLRDLLGTFNTTRGVSSFLNTSPYFIDFRPADKALNVQQK